MTKFEIDYIAEGNYFKIVFEGEVYIEDLIQSYTFCRAQPQHKQGCGFLADFRDSIPLMDYQSMDKLYAFASQYQHLFNKTYRSAVLVEDEIDQSTFELWNVHSNQLDFEEYKVFIELKAAQSWLSEN